MSKINTFTQSIQKKQHDIYTELENFIKNEITQHFDLSDNNNNASVLTCVLGDDIYLVDPDSYDGKYRKVCGIELFNNQTVSILLKNDEENDGEYLNYPISCFLVEDICTIILDCFD